MEDIPRKKILSRRETHACFKITHVKEPGGNAIPCAQLLESIRLIFLPEVIKKWSAQIWKEISADRTDTNEHHDEHKNHQTWEQHRDEHINHHKDWHRDQYWQTDTKTSTMIWSTQRFTQRSAQILLHGSLWFFCLSVLKLLQRMWKLCLPFQSRSVVHTGLLRHN